MEDDRKKELTFALLYAKYALEHCYDVADYPANGKTLQDEALRIVYKALEKL